MCVYVVQFYGGRLGGPRKDSVRQGLVQYYPDLVAHGGMAYMPHQNKHYQISVR